MQQWYRRVRAWFQAHPMGWDALFALPFLPMAFASVGMAAPGDSLAATASLAGVTVMAICMWVPLLWRRTRPVVMAAGVATGHVLQLVLVHEMVPGNIVVPVVLYAVGRYEARRVLARAFLALALVGSALAGWDWAFRAPSAFPRSDLAYAVWTGTSCALVAGSSWGFGLLARQRTLSVQHLRERAEALERERERDSKLAAEEERTRIAREMHDVVAHSLSVIVVQADGAAYAVANGDKDLAAQTAATVLDTIAATARDALADTRRLVAVLRGGEDAPEYAPQAGVGDLDRLVAPLRAAGRHVDLVVTGTPQPLPRDADLAVYRVVQESLTNVIKHAEAHATVRVDLAYHPDAVSVSIVNDGRPPVPGDGRGHGLIGMRERVGAYGGTLDAGPRFGGGFGVRATVPLHKSSTREPAATTGDTSAVASPAAATPPDASATHHPAAAAFPRAR